MANSSTVYTAAETKTALEEETWTNPSIKAAPGNSTGQRIFNLTLVLDGGVTFKPLEIYEALDTKFEAIASNKLPQRNCLELVIHKTSETVELEQGENPQSIP